MRTHRRAPNIALPTLPAHFVMTPVEHGQGFA